MDPVLCLQEVVITYRTRSRLHTAVNRLSLSVSHGEIFGFLGPNGAGKTSTIKAIINLIPLTAGNILLFGKNPAQAAARRRIGYMPEIATYYWYLTPRELLRMYAGVCGLPGRPARQRIDALLEQAGLQAEADMLLRDFSKGMMQKVSLAQALLHDPDFYLFDEPMSGLDPLARLQVRDLMKELRGKGKTVFFSSHELSEAEMVCDRVAIVHQGQLLKAAALADILHSKGQSRSLEQYFIEIIGAGAAGGR
ncbi:MAG: ABC transporter ATP-binding protein [Candidatus Omnitrophica bacterium]|nr:ABC transporter ATP-binding protein [Candidatus Omnitrophota bacterium]